MKPLRICIDARLSSGTAGGIEQVVMGMASGLSQLKDGDEEYLLLAHQNNDAWIKPYLSGNCKLLYTQTVQVSASKSLLSRLPMARAAWDQLSPMLLGARSYSIPVSDGTIEKAGVDLMHFLFQNGFITSLPTIYHPHDLQHRHLPHYFTPRGRMGRDLLFKALCGQAQMVAVAASWGKKDLICHYKLPEEKVQVIPLAPSNEHYPVPTEEDYVATRAKFSLPDSFIFFPAQTFAHKNHLGLLDALALLRDKKGLVIPFVSSGRLNDYYKTIQRRVRKNQLSAQTQFLDFVSPLELQCLYKLCRCVVIPTKFEAASFPIWDAFLAGTPVACSNVTSLPQQVGKEALLFDPEDTGAIADAIQKLWTDPLLCKKLVAGGRANVTRFTWSRTVRHFRAHYRRIAGRLLTDEDWQILQAPPLL